MAALRTDDGLGGPGGPKLTRILVVDDSETSRDITCAFLAAAGYGDVATAASGEAALALLGEAGQPPFDAVLLDVMMEGMDGIEACARIRSDPRWADLPVLMLTAASEADILGQAFVAGATDFITKPVRRVELSARLRSALRLKAELDRRRDREAALEEALRTGAPEPILADRVTGLPDAAAFNALLGAAREGTTVVAVLLDRAEVLLEVGLLDPARRALAEVVGGIPAPLGAMLADLGRGLLAVLLPPGRAPGDFALAIRDTVRAAGIPVPAGSLAGTLSVSVGQAGPSAHPRAALADAIATAERVAARGGDEAGAP